MTSNIRWADSARMFTRSRRNSWSSDFETKTFFKEKYDLVNPFYSSAQVLLPAQSSIGNLRRRKIFLSSSKSEVYGNCMHTNKEPIIGTHHSKAWCNLSDKLALKIFAFLSFQPCYRALRSWRKGRILMILQAMIKLSVAPCNSSVLSKALFLWTFSWSNFDTSRFLDTFFEWSDHEFNITLHFEW